MDYVELKNKQQKEIDAFPMVFAFSNNQLAEGMEKLGLKETDTDKIYSIGGGGYIRKTDSKELDEMMERHTQEMQERTEDEDFIFSMFNYELANHEFCITGDITSTISALGYTVKEVESSKKLLSGLKKAIANQFDQEVG